ncbi:MAG: hypothetical protein JST93_21895 [Acidobacteria bacterium]|nr:hypothetical protein [Acidobacteriota bacterium]
MLLRIALMLTASCGLAQEPWRSALYPEDWTPSFRDAQGRFLHDFSYAGYERGEVPVPDVAGRIVDVVAEFQADPSGASDSTAQIQAALDAVGSSGGGVVYLPAGLYRVAPRGNDAFALWMKYDHVVLRGAGAGVTFLHNSTAAMRGKEIIRVAPLGGGTWTTVIANSTVTIVEDYPEPTLQLKVRDTASLKAGDWILVRSDASNEFIAEHQMTNWWTPARQTGPIFYRQVVAVDADARVITLDAPTRYALRMRDNARVYKTRAQVQGVGLEDFSIGGTESVLSGFGEEDYSTQGTGAYEVHGAHAVAFRQALFGWMRRVTTFQPEGNARGYHLVSNGVLLNQTRGITVEDSTFEKPQYRGGGGNGYGFTLSGNENLLRNLTAVAQRHSFDFKSMAGSGNVIASCRSVNPSLASDYHMHLSMANLWDNVSLNGDYADATVRPYGTPDYHGVTTTQSVFWNTEGVRYMTGRAYLINSQQFGWGYVIGTRGNASAVRTAPYAFRYTSPVVSSVDTAPEDFVEGVGSGDRLEPWSLYEDQLARRLAR